MATGDASRLLEQVRPMPEPREWENWSPAQAADWAMDPKVRTAGVAVVPAPTSDTKAFLLACREIRLKTLQQEDDARVIWDAALAHARGVALPDGGKTMNEAQERAAFEASITDRFKTPDRIFQPEEMFYRVEHERYFKGWLQSQWEGWMARAAHGVVEAGHQTFPPSPSDES